MAKMTGKSEWLAVTAEEAWPGELALENVKIRVRFFVCSEIER